jgi:mono/diheme cytochrome c family protein
MSNHNQTEKDEEIVTTPRADAARKADEPSKAKRELTDDEIASVAGGVSKRPPGGVVFGSTF